MDSISNMSLLSLCVYHIPFQISYSDWPINIFAGDFYNIYISGRSYEDKYASLQNLDRDNMSDLDLLMAERLVKRNFLSAYILIEQDVKEYRDTPKMTTASILAQLAATQNLWAGITVIIVVEFIELLYEALQKKCKSSKTGTE